MNSFNRDTNKDQVPALINRVESWVFPTLIKIGPGWWWGMKDKIRDAPRAFPLRILRKKQRER